MTHITWTEGEQELLRRLDEVPPEGAVVMSCADLRRLRAMLQAKHDLREVSAGPTSTYLALRDEILNFNGWKDRRYGDAARLLDRAAEALLAADRQRVGFDGKLASAHKSLRDEFAMAVLTGLVVRMEAKEHRASLAYEIADAMLAERERKP